MKILKRIINLVVNVLPCHLFEQGSHPDFMLLTPGQDEDTGNARKLLQIKIDSVREVLQFSQITSHRGGLKVIVINPAESMNVQAANALLKVLEEPPQNVVFILVSSQKDRLLPTIKAVVALLFWIYRIKSRH